MNEVTKGIIAADEPCTIFFGIYLFDVRCYKSNCNTDATIIGLIGIRSMNDLHMMQ